MVAPARWAAAAEIMPSPWPSTVFPTPKAIKKNAAVPTAATIPAKVAGTKALGSSRPEICTRFSLFSLITGSTSVGEDRFWLKAPAASVRATRTQKAAADLVSDGSCPARIDHREFTPTLTLPG
jgi:hypothetical protein